MEENIWIEQNNSAFIIIPFTISSNTRVEKFIQELLMTNNWKQSDIKIKFLYKYITQKLFCENHRKQKCFVVEYASHSATVADTEIFLTEESCILPSSSLGGLNCPSYNFIIDSTRIIAFSSNIGMVAFNLHFLCEDADCMTVANSLYFLKKISEVKFKNCVSESRGVSWISLAKSILSANSKRVNRSTLLDFSYYSEERFSRANFFVTVKNDSNNKNDNNNYQKLYYLKHGFTQNYDLISTDTAYYCAPNGRKWGISSEGCACLITAEDRLVIRKQISEFQGEYFLLYCLLLHQKYFYYKLLMQLGQPEGISSHKLKKYKSDLVGFESDFVFSTVTEVPQYQGVYEILFSQLHLSNLYADVKEPISNINNNKIEKNERAVSIIGFFVSLLGLFSILADGYFIINLFFGGNVALLFVKIFIGIASIALLFCVVTVTIKVLLKK